MQLSELLVALSGNKGLFVTLTDTTGVEIITFNAGGYEAVESDLGTREVEKISIDGLTKMTVALKDAP